MKEESVGLEELLKADTDTDMETAADTHNETDMDMDTDRNVRASAGDGIEAGRSKVCMLDPHTINQIAAGEVVERPASALKELIENAIDAGATRIAIDLEQAGRSLIRVSDNGCGMSEADARLALLRHATSKIRSADDLHRVSTLGFRGEALPSMASVSRLTLKTATSDGRRTVLQAEGGEVTSLPPEAGPMGTEITLRDLFFSTPARLKFLKSDNSELGACLDAAGRLAIGRPDIAFVLRHGPREAFRTHGEGDLYEAIANFWNRDFVSGMAPVDAEAAGVRLRGYVSPPYLTKPTRAYQFLYVNGRSVRSRSLTIALDQAYRDLTPERRFPAVALMLEVDPALVDVNVSPTKSEVRFQREGAVFEAVRVAIRGALLEHGMIPSARAAATVNEALSAIASASRPAPLLLVDPPLRFNHREESSWIERVERAGSERPGREPAVSHSPAGDGPEGSHSAGSHSAGSHSAGSLADDDASVPPYGSHALAMPDDRLAAGDGVADSGASAAEPIAALSADLTGSGPQSWSGLHSGPGLQSGPGLSAGSAAPEGESLSEPPAEPGSVEGSEPPSSAVMDRSAVDRSLQGGSRPFEELIDGLQVIGQAMNTFIIAETKRGLVIIDQHVAHERILYEHLYRTGGRGALESQPLLHPLVLHLDRRTYVLACERLDDIRRSGFDVEPFGGEEVQGAPSAEFGSVSGAASGDAALIVRSIPAVIRSKDPLKVLRTIVEELAEGAAARRISPTCEQVWAMASCKMAVKAGDPLSIAEMTKLVEDLALTENPYLCPHGRPITVTLDSHALLRLFKRT